MIGKHERKEARDSGFKEALSIGLDEALTALEESLHDLTDEQLRAFPIPGRNNIAWVAMHSLQNLDRYTNEFQTGRATFAHDRRWDGWKDPPDQRPRPGDAFPAQQEVMRILIGVREAAQAGLAAASEVDLRGRRTAQEWWKKTSADAYLRTICHTMAHVRQVWLLRGALGLTDGKSWPAQHWA